ncbi:aldose 1-epimerase family protein [Nocardioides sp. CPCC 206347]|uniref:aldose 1-epimerase family protein n=2 Tax=Nocardioides TaxID=1839 RepID=UPI003B43D649
MKPPSGDQFVIESAGHRAVVTESGGALRELTFEGRPLIEGFAEDAMADGGRGQLLMPWPNRIRDGRYTFGGKQQQLALTEPSRQNASHGLVRWVAWSVVSHEVDRLELGYFLPAQTGYPWALDLRVTYTVGPDGLHVTQAATNLASTAAPYASGAHPYLVAGDGPCDGWRMELPAATYLTVDTERLLPTGRDSFSGLVTDPLGETVLNHGVTDVDRDDEGVATIRLSADDTGVELWVDEHHRWLQVYTGEDTRTPRSSVAIEPMTAPPDAFNSGDDLVVLEPGTTFAATWGIRAV